MVDPSVDAGRECGGRYFCERAEATREAGVPVTFAMLSQWITDAIAVACERAVEAEREREKAYKEDVRRWMNNEPAPEAE